MSEEIKNTEIVTPEEVAVTSNDDANLRVMRSRDISRVKTGAKIGKILGNIVSTFSLYLSQLSFSFRSIG